MVKIHILGGPGSGKTTLAQRLSSKFHIPHYDLDKVNWEQENAIAIAEQSAWITEGVYLIWTKPMFYHADYIVLLTASWPVAAWRMIRRHVLNSLRGANPYPGLNGIQLLFKLLKDARRYYLNENSPGLSEQSLQTCLEAHQQVTTPLTEEFMQMYFETHQALAVPPTEKFVRMYLEMYKGKVFLVRNAADRERLITLAILKG